MIRLLLAFLLISFSGTFVFAETLTAVCGGMTGYGFFLKDGQIQGDTDSLVGTTQVITWDTDSRDATIVGQHSLSAGGTPTNAKAVAMTITKKQISFLSITDNGIEIYSLYPATETLFWSAQNDLDYLGKNAATVKAMHTKCKISLTGEPATKKK